MWLTAPITYMELNFPGDFYTQAATLFILVGEYSKLRCYLSLRQALKALIEFTNLRTILQTIRDVCNSQNKSSPVEINPPQHNQIA